MYSYPSLSAYKRAWRYGLCAGMCVSSPSGKVLCGAFIFRFWEIRKHSSSVRPGYTLLLLFQLTYDVTTECCLHLGSATDFLCSERQILSTPDLQTFFSIELETSLSCGSWVRFPFIRELPFLPSRITRFQTWQFEDSLGDIWSFREREKQLDIPAFMCSILLVLGSANTPGHCA